MTETLRDLLDCYRDAAYETGYYAATLEKVALITEQRVEYEALLAAAIAERENRRELIEEWAVSRMRR